MMGRMGILGVMLAFIGQGALQAFDVTLLDLKGKPKRLDRESFLKPTVVVFLGTECPVSNGMVPTMNRVSEEKRVDFIGVVSEALVTRWEAVEHSAKFQLKFPVLFDGSGILAAELKPTHVPEVFVFSGEGDLVYRGAIDNTFETPGRRRPKAEQEYLRDAVVAVLEGKVPAVAKTDPVGCLFEAPGIAGAKESPVTYTRDIAPILNARCVSCHRKGQAPPFSLTSYRLASRKGRQMVEVTHGRTMPPWMAPPERQPSFVGERWLSDEELALIKQWVETGKVEGDPADLPPAQEFSSDWELGKPDLILRMQEKFTVPADGPDILQNFVIPVEIPEDKLVRAIQFRPGTPSVVHHSVLFLDDKGQARKLDAATPEPGYSNFGGAGFLPSGALGGWSVGNTARELPGGRGRYLKKGSDLVMQIHYHPTGREESDQSEVGVYFIDRPVEEVLKEPGKLVGSFWMSDYEIDIPPGEADYRKTVRYQLPKDVTLVGLVPHMHLLGKSMHVTAKPPGEKPFSLIEIDQWNYNWQDEFYYEKPFVLRAGTELTVEAVFDNSEENPGNPASPPIRVGWGDGTLDEMLFCFFLISAERNEELLHVIFDSLGEDLKKPRTAKKSK